MRDDLSLRGSRGEAAPFPSLKLDFPAHCKILANPSRYDTVVEGPDRRDSSPSCTNTPISPTQSECSGSSSSSISSPVLTAKKKYIRKEKIGQGAQGSVYRCIEVSTGREVAAKVINSHELSKAELEAVKREVKTMKRLHHPNLVEYYKATEKKRKELCIYMEYVAGGSLSAKLRQLSEETKTSGLDLPLVQRYTRQLCQALQYLHANRIAHRDIKCANVFLNLRGTELKLGDFGAFKEIGSVSLVSGIKGTPHWMAPEVIREQQTSDDGWLKADIWSLGCAVIEMMTGHSPWQQYSNPLAAMYQIVSSDKIPTFPANATEEATAFLKLCLQRNPDDRSTTTQLLAHPFLQEKTCGPNNIENNCAVNTIISPRRLESKIPMPSASRRRHETTVINSAQIDNQRSTLTNTSTVKKQSTLSNKGQLMTAEPKISSPLDYSKVTKRDASSSHQNVSSLAIVHPLLCNPPIPNTSAPDQTRKSSQIPRLRPLEALKNSNNQDKEATVKQVIARGTSVSRLGIDKSNSSLCRHHGTTKLRRLSTAPANMSRDPEDIIGSNKDRPKLPPITARTTTTATFPINLV